MARHKGVNYGYKQLEGVMLKWLNATIKPWKQLQ